MKLLKKIGIGLLALILLLVVISFFLPQHIHVEETAVVQSKPETVYAMVNDVKRWHEWSPWHKMDSAHTKWQYSEPSSGTGAWYTWESEGDLGNGKFTFINNTPPKEIKAELVFEDMPPSAITFLFEPVSEGTRVSWILDRDMGMDPLGKWFGVMMRGFLAKDFAKGLKNLQEAAPKAEAAASPEVAGCRSEMREIEAVTVAGIHEKIAIKTLDTKFGSWYQAIGKALDKEGAEPKGYPLAIYYSYDQKAGTADVEAAMGVKAAGKDDKQVKFHELPATKAFVLTYTGGYSRMENVYGAAYHYIGEKGWTSTGAPRELYIAGPGNEPDSNKWVTEIQFPVQ